jgi:Zn finger protein HypA/HybF involved in hydrogenase expression
LFLRTSSAYTAFLSLESNGRDGCSEGEQPERPDQVLSVTCPNCSHTFASVIQADAETWKEIDVEGIVERCPNCSEATMFEKSDYRFMEPS